jgi:hypothetical protein
MTAPVFPGIHPVGPCLDRLFDREVMALSRFLAFEAAPFVDATTGRTVPAPDLAGLKAAIIAEQPERVEARKFDLEFAACWELQTYGAILLDENPYYQPQQYVTEERKAA